MKTREQKRIEATARQAEFAALSRAEKLDRIAGRRGESRKELRRMGIEVKS